MTTTGATTRFVLGTTSSTALDLLRSDELDEVLRHFSEQPSHPHWDRLIGSEDLGTLSRCGGSLTSAAQRRISVLMLALECDDDAELLCDVLKTFGPQCIELQIVALKVVSLSVFHAAYAQHCTAIRSLSLILVADAPSVDLFLAPVSRTLTNLRVECNKARVGALYSSIARHCSTLEKLDLQVESRNVPGLSKMFWEVGPSLKHLILTVSDAMLPPNLHDAEALNLPALARQCPKLNHLELYGDLEGARGHAETLVLLLCARLHRLSLSFIGQRPTFLLRVKECCPNVKIDTDVLPSAMLPGEYYYGERANPGPTMRVLSDLLDVFSFRDGFRHDTTFATDVTAACAIRDLSIKEIRDGGNELMRTIFSSRRTQLGRLWLSFNSAAPDIIAESLRIVACNTGTLHDFTIIGPPLPQEAMEIFAKTNNSLRSVRVLRNVEPDSKIVAVLTAIDSFNTSKYLRFLFPSDIVGVQWRRPSQDWRLRKRYCALRERRVVLTIDRVVQVK